ncbi:hypothetical protein ACIQU6_14695 [Streptomyces sp. NPDC090442]|uniref:hypothetical protein n=1 Tax=Streptomyces sp. NPDC090442 TaxID=3365962 RepID=UPI003830E3E9
MTTRANAAALLVNGLRATRPAEARVIRDMTVILHRRNGPEPDVPYAIDIDLTAIDEL